MAIKKYIGPNRLSEIFSYIKAELDKKVTAVSGKGLSSNDYTTTEKNKLAGISSGAEVNVQADWDVDNTSSDAYILHKPTSMPASDVPSWAKQPNKPSYTFSDITNTPTTIAGYGITDAKIASGTITLGSNSITPLTQHQTVSNKGATLAWSSAVTVATIGGTDIKVSLPANPNTDTTYTFADGTNGFTVTPSGGTAQTVKVTPSITNNVTGSGTSGYLAKFNGANTITSGPQLGSGTTTYLRNDGSWATPTDTKNTAGSTDTSSKIFLIGATSQGTNPQTYSHDTAYVGTDGCLYSGGAKVLTSHQDISGKADKATTLAGYGITDAKIANGTITLGSNTITPLTQHQDISGKADKSATVSTVTWSSNKLTKTINGNTTDVVTAATILGNLTKAQVTTALGYTPPTTDTNTTYTIATGDSNGQIKVTPSSGSAYNVSVKGLGSRAYDSTEYIPKLTYEYNKEISFGSTGKLLIGKFPCYDSNVTIEINTTTSITYHATAVLATQNINNSHGGSIKWDVYGDEADTITSNLYLYYPNNSRYIEIYFSPASWSKNLIHIRCVALSVAPTNICENISEIPSTATTKPTNMYKAGSVNYATSAGSVAWSNVSSKPTTISGYGITDAKIANGTITLGSNTITPLTSITSSQVTTALGYTPYNSSNPNGYITSSGSCAYATSAGSATKATQDDNGDTIKSTYMKKGVDYVTAGTASNTYAAAYATAEGYGNTSSGRYSHAEGYGNTVTTDAQEAHVEGWNSTVSANGAHAEGLHTTASGLAAHAEGSYFETYISGVAYQYYNLASGEGSHVEGLGTVASGIGAHAEGSAYRVSNSIIQPTSASGDGSHAEGLATTAAGEYSHSEGFLTHADGNYSHAEGDHTYASSDYQHVEGKYNVLDTNGTYAHIIGGGTDSTRKNIFTVDWNGDVCAGRSNGLTNSTKLPTGADVIGYLVNKHYARVGSSTVSKTTDQYGQFSLSVSNGYIVACGVDYRYWVMRHGETSFRLMNQGTYSVKASTTVTVWYIYVIYSS